MSDIIIGKKLKNDLLLKSGGGMSGVRMCMRGAASGIRMHIRTEQFRYAAE